jgi:plasmid stabilization system protein ParE
MKLLRRYAVNGKYNVRLTLVARADLKGILDYISIDRPATADRLERRFAERIKSLQYNPERFPKVREQFHAKFIYRHILVNPYRIIFRILALKS